MEKGSFPRPGAGDVDWFDSLVPDRPEVTRRRMFGGLAAFAGDAMFLCLFGDRVAVRLDEPERAALLAEPDAAVFEPMPGRPMKEYVVLPSQWREEPDRAREWVERSADYAGTLPPKRRR